MSTFKRQLPNILTVARIPLAFLCIYFAITLKPVSLTISLVLFILASFTDYLDGYLARKWNIVSNFGKIVDPIADKILILGVFIVFTYNGIVPIVMTVAIALREVILTVVRLMLLPKKVVLAARISGKFKTFTQCSVLTIIYLIFIFKGPLNELVHTDIIRNTILLLIFWTMCITVYSGISFFRINRKALSKLY